MKTAFLLVIIVSLCSVFGFAEKDPADYPLKVHILQQQWSSHNLRYNEYRATGRGNIWEGTSIRGFDFTYDCSFGLRKTARNQPYAAKWKKPQFRLELLAAEIGKDSKYQQCELKTTVRDGVYILHGGGVTEMSQDDFKAMRTKRTAKFDQQTEAAADASSEPEASSK